jgi:N-acetyl-anhydromuramyl-L-alanine amidase AmpD
VPAEVSPIPVRRWRSTNSWLGRPYGPPIAFVVHTSSGGESGTVAESLSSSSELSAHYVARLDGTLDSWIDPADRAWSNGILEPGNTWAMIAEDCGVDPALNPNHVTVTCETEDHGDPGQPVSARQYEAVLYAAWEAKQRYPHSLRYLACHADISPHSRANCPGERWMSGGQFQSMADRLGLKTVSTVGISEACA